MKKTNRIRVGVIGLGQIAVRSHLPGYSKLKECRVAAVCSGRPEHAARIALQYGVPMVFKDWRKLLASDGIDAVSICTPNHTHFPIALMALREGKHVLVEKPMAMDTGEARRLIAEAGKSGRVLMVHQNMRFDPAVRTAEKLLRRNAIGKVLAFKCSLTHRGPQAWSPQAKWFFQKKLAGGGALMDLGPHLFDTLRFLLGDEPRVAGAVASFRGKGPGAGQDTHCSVLLRFKRGAVGSVTVGWEDTGYQNDFYFFGTRGTLAVNLAKGDPVVLEMKDRPGKVTPPLLNYKFVPSIYEHFLHSILRKKKPWVSGKDGLRTLELVASTYRVLRSDRKAGA